MSAFQQKIAKKAKNIPIYKCKETDLKHTAVEYGLNLTTGMHSKGWYCNVRKVTRAVVVLLLRITFNDTVFDINTLLWDYFTHILIEYN